MFHLGHPTATTNVTARQLNVVLVSGDPLWTIPVRWAVEAEGGVVETTSARGAVARLTGPKSPVSHVLIDHNEADGLLPTLIGLTSAAAGPAAALLLLGNPPQALARTTTIRSADHQSIVRGLSARPVAPGAGQPTLPPAELLEVMDGGMIETWYQPIVRLADRGVAAVEVLARLDHPVHGSLTPDWFVSRFEDAGMSFALTDQVTRRAFADQAGTLFRHLGLAMAVNYPLAVLSHPDAATRLDEKRAAAGLTRDQVQIELTESRPVEDFTALGRSLDQLRALGYRVAIDDVGPAVKHLDRLLTLPFTGLKLDKSIVRPIGTETPAASIAPRVIDQALRRGMSVVAEGVESAAMWSHLRALGVQEAQGYFIARPLPAPAVPVWLETWNQG